MSYNPKDWSAFYIFYQFHTTISLLLDPVEVRTQWPNWKKWYGDKFAKFPMSTWDIIIRKMWRKP